jgi:hypothetical protein
MLETLSLLMPQVENCLRGSLKNSIIVNLNLIEKYEINILKLLESCIKNKFLNKKH